MKLYNQINSLVCLLFRNLLIYRLMKFRSSKRLLLVFCVSFFLFIELCGQLSKLGDIFMSNVTESDPEHTQKIASAFDTIMKSCGGEPLESAVLYYSLMIYYRHNVLMKRFLDF